MPNRIVDVGAQDQELKNSPIADEGDEDTEALREALPGAPVCYFNGIAYSHGAIIKSGSQALRCERGLWVRAGSGDPYAG
jgi:hypothetical protein